MKIKFSEILGDMIASYNAKSGEKIDENSVDYKKIEAVASELYAISCYGDFILKQAFVQTATGEYLDNHGIMRSCDRKIGRVATGVLTFSVSEAQSEDIVIEQGTICASSKDALIQFKTINTATLKAGEVSVDVQVRALKMGAKYNSKAGEITVLVNAPAKIESVINKTDINGGSDFESDSAYRKRIMANFCLPLNGYNRYSVESVIKNLSQVDDCEVRFSEEQRRVDVVVSSSVELSDTVLRTIENSVAQAELFGIQVNVIQAKRVDFNIKAKILVDVIYDEDAQKQEMYNSLFEVLDRKKIGHTITLDELKNVAFKSDWVKGISIESDNLVNNSIVCSSKEFLNLSSLEVELYDV